MSPNPLSVLEQHGRTFHFASHLLGEEYRMRAAVLYAFCRHVDDLADKSDNTAVARRDLLYVRRDLMVAGQTSTVCRDMAALIQETSMPLTPVLSLIDGAIQDLEPVKIASEAQLIQYAYHVAGTVGLMMCSVLDVTDRKALPYAIDLGIAMQLTNIARDVGEDAELGRIYLPSDWLGNLEPHHIQDPTQTQAQTLKVATRRMLQLADEYYQSGLQGLYFLPRGARWSILVAAHVYREIGTLIAQADYQTWDRRAIVSKPRKLQRAGLAIAHHILKNRIHRPEPRHNPAMHRHLQQHYGTHQYKVA